MNIEDFKFTEDQKKFVTEEIDRLKKLENKSQTEEIILTLVSNIESGTPTKQQISSFERIMKNEFKKKDIDILNVYYCPHNPDDNCSCRKPKTGMILQSLNDFEINLNNSWLIGDKISDIECAKNGNIPNRILINENIVDSKDFLLAKSLLDSVKYIKK